MELAAVKRTEVGNAASEETSTATFEPFFRFARVSRLQTINGRLGVQQQQFIGDGGQSTSPSVALDGRTTIIDRRLWFDAQASAVSRSISNDGFSDDSPTNEDQTTTALQVQLGPELKFQPTDGTLLRSKAGVARNQLSRNAGDDSSSIGFEFSLLQAVSRQGVLLTVGSNYQNTMFDGGGEAALGTFTVGGVVPISSRLAAYSRVGYDWVSISDMDEMYEEQFALGVRWTPSRRLELNAEYAERAFGRQPSVSLVLSGRRSQLIFRWRRDLQIRQFLDTNVERFDVEEDIGNNSSDEDTSVNLESTQFCDDTDSADCIQPTFLVNAETIEEVIAATYVLRGRVSTFRTSVTGTQLSNFEGANSRQRNELQVSVSRSLFKNVRLTLSGGFSETRSDAEDSTTSRLQTLRTSITWSSR